MNGRIWEGETPEERLAAVAVMVRERLRRIRKEREPDYADLRDAFRIPLELEMVRARILEVTEMGRIQALGSFVLFRLRELRAEEDRLFRLVQEEAKKK